VYWHYCSVRFRREWRTVRLRDEQLGTAMINGRGRNPINFVSVRDVARFVVQALSDPPLRNRMIEVAGPQNLTLDQVVGVVEQVFGRRAKTRHMSLAVMRILMKPMNPALARLIHTAILMDTTDQTMDPGALLGEFPTELRRLEDVLRDQFASEKAGSVHSQTIALA